MTRPRSLESTNTIAIPVSPQRDGSTLSLEAVLDNGKVVRALRTRSIYPAVVDTLEEMLKGGNHE